jgi:hypothetical protein
MPPPHIKSIILIGKHESPAPFFSACVPRTIKLIAHTDRKVVTFRFAETHYNLHQPLGQRPRGFQSFNVNLIFSSFMALNFCSHV